MKVNRERLWSNIMNLAKIGRNEDGGMTRLSFTQAEQEAKAFVSDVMRQAGLAVYEDAIGNLFGIKEGKNPNAPAILIGSHIDSVINGGIFDGPAGVLSGVEVLHTLDEAGWQGECPIEVVAFTDEEGARFSTGMLGSQALAGQLTQEFLNDHKDADGVSIAEAMKAAGYDPLNIHEGRRDPSTMKAYLELHIEQGRVLEDRRRSVGIVTGIVGLRWLQLRLKGEAGHAGTTPMELRKDPLAAASTIIKYFEETVRKEERAVGTVGRIHVQPGGINIIPGEVELTFDIRDLSTETLDNIQSVMQKHIDIVCEERGIGYECEVLHRIEPATCSPHIIEAFNQATEAVGLEPFQLASGAGHDAMVMANLTDMGMIFVRSKGGISHNPQEWTDKEDLGDGADVLLRTLLKLAHA